MAEKKMLHSCPFKGHNLWIGSEMAEPKQLAPSLSDASSAKKATKKISRPKPPPEEASPAAAAVASASAPSGPSASSAQSPVPKLHLSEPKLDPTNGTMPTESKPRASKKRTSTPPTGGPEIPVAAGPPAATTGGGPSLGPPDAAAMAKQAADVEKEKQAAAARREAKRLRAKEVEDAKRCEELAKQALGEAKRQEEQRQREARRQQELAALNANAEECQDEEPEERNDYDDEGFENYDDDFENDDDQSKAGSKLTAASTKKSDSNDKASALELKKIQQALQAESKELLSSSRPSSSSKSAANDQQQQSRAPAASSTIASSIAGLKKSMDPRAKRVKDILEARKLEVDKFNLFQQAPLSDLEKYMTHLRRGNVRQAFVQSNDGAKATATQTKPSIVLHKGMHFPDDIGLDSSSSLSSGNPEDEDHSSTSTVRFFKFLEHAAYVCEVLSEENVLEAERELEAKSQQTRRTISSDLVWTQKQIFPTKKLDNETLEKLLRGRDIVAMQFSKSTSNLLLTCYGFQSQSTEPSSRVYKDKGIACIWDVTQPQNAPRVLKCEGLITTGCFGPSRDLFVLVGTEDGSIHVWDLRSSTTGMDDGLVFRSPTYSTCGIDYKTANQHTSAIVALESIHDAPLNSKSAGSAAGGGNFQFGSMDDRGVVVIWSVIEFEAGDEALFADKCVEIGGRVKLVLNTCIDTQQQYMMPKKPTNTTKRNVNRGILTDSKGDTAAKVFPLRVGPIATVFNFFPSDQNQ